MPFSNRVVSAALAAIIAIPASVALSASLSEPTLAAPTDGLTEAQAPVFNVGEEWVFSYTNVLEPAKNHNYTQKVSSVTNGKTDLVGVGENSALTVLDTSANLVSSSGASYDPSDQKLQFPLAVGKTWSTSYVYRFGAWIAHCDRQAKVVGVERVELPAGSFDAFKIEQVISWSGNSGYGSHGTTHETDWYVPAVGRIAKMDYENVPLKAPATTTHLELLRFYPASESSAH